MIRLARILCWLGQHRWSAEWHDRRGFSQRVCSRCGADRKRMWGE